jgi:SAM-dependent MidA family methyltransferase
LQVGPRGDFATSPSLGSDFAALLAPQIAQWLQLQQGPLALIEAGPGEGDLAADLADALVAGWPELAARLELVLIEPNAGMAARQRQRLAGCPLPVRWCSVADLAAAPRRGVLLAHEVLDALAVERVIWDGSHWRRELVVLEGAESPEPQLRQVPGDPLDPKADALLWEQLVVRGLAGCGGGSAAGRLPAGWTTELHPTLAAWLAAAGAALEAGVLLVIDYALEAWRYNAATRSAGTLMAYRAQQASGDPLRSPGSWDLTAHLCLETLDAAALASDWRLLGQRRQGEALLALGLAGRLHALQHSDPSRLASALASREALLRLVDPAGLGDFRWIAYERGAPRVPGGSMFLTDPPSLNHGC